MIWREWRVTWRKTPDGDTHVVTWSEQNIPGAEQHARTYRRMLAQELEDADLPGEPELSVRTVTMTNWESV
jgi:hypothetical protein